MKRLLLSSSLKMWRWGLVVFVYLGLGGCLFTPIHSPLEATRPAAIPATEIPCSTLPYPTFTPTPATLPFPTPAKSELSGYVVFDRLVEVVNFRSQIFLVNLDTGEITQLTDLASNHTPTWSPDGRQIVFVSSWDGDDNLYLMDQDGRNQQRLTKYRGNEMLPDWSPDGSKIAFVSDHNGNDEIYVIDVETRDVTQLTNNAGTDFDPSWSSDGKRIAFSSDRMHDGLFQIFIMNADGSNVEQVVEELSLDGNPVWCPDDTCLIFERHTGHRGRVLRLMKVDLQSREIEPLLKGTNATTPDIDEWYPSKSPVRGYIAFTIGDDLYALDIQNDRLYSLGLKVIGAALYP